MFYIIVHLCICWCSNVPWVVNIEQRIPACHTSDHLSMELKKESHHGGHPNHIYACYHWNHRQGAFIVMLRFLLNQKIALDICWHAGASVFTLPSERLTVEGAASDVTRSLATTNETGELLQLYSVNWNIDLLSMAWCEIRLDYPPPTPVKALLYCV